MKPESWGCHLDSERRFTWLCKHSLFSSLLIPCSKMEKSLKNPGLICLFVATEACLWYTKQDQSIKEINTAPFSGSTTSLIINILLILVWSWEADTAATTAHVTACMPLSENLIKWAGSWLYCSTQYHMLSLNQSTHMQFPFTCAHINTCTEKIEGLHLNTLSYSTTHIKF